MKARSGRGEVVPPPHPRGSTPSYPATWRSAIPSPAPAGIHPRSSTAPSLRSALPRTRGDPPRPPAGQTACARPPPHPRGSTRTAAQTRSTEAPSPAPAGSTLRRNGATDWSLPSPAPAGIHPRSRNQAASSVTLPRTRGDPPKTWPDEVRQWNPPPHPRGSTLVARWMGSPGAPSPAPAGIHPRCGMPSLCASALPRTRGDPPRASVERTVAPAPPPHPRGSTRAIANLPEDAQPSPAPAGIHPLALIEQGLQVSLPRTRGDPPRWNDPARA